MNIILKNKDMNIQDEIQKIHHKYGASEMANYKIQLFIEELIEKSERKYQKEPTQKKEEKETQKQVIGGNIKQTTLVLTLGGNNREKTLW